jgi:hypothetical protein
MATAVATISTGAVYAHDGHGLAASHWHASDTAGFIVVAVLAALAVWWSRSE